MAKNAIQTVKLEQPIDLRYRCAKDFRGERKLYPTTRWKQRRLKKMVCKIFPDNMFYDDLEQGNSVIAEKVWPYENTTDSPIDLRRRYKVTLLGKRKNVAATPRQQIRLKRVFLELFPEGTFTDDLEKYYAEKARKKESQTLGEYYAEKGGQLTGGDSEDTACDWYEVDDFHAGHDDDHSSHSDHDDCDCDDGCDDGGCDCGGDD